MKLQAGWWLIPRPTLWTCWMAGHRSKMCAASPLPAQIQCARRLKVLKVTRAHTFSRGGERQGVFGVNWKTVTLLCCSDRRCIHWGEALQDLLRRTGDPGKSVQRTEIALWILASIKTLWILASIKALWILASIKAIRDVYARPESFKFPLPCSMFFFAPSVNSCFPAHCYDVTRSSSHTLLIPHASHPIRCHRRP